MSNLIKLFCIFFVLCGVKINVAHGLEADMKVAVFAGGCFWCMEPPFDKLDGVSATVSGYIGGHVKNPDYKAVTRGRTGHYEAVEVTYDPKVISYAELLSVFWVNIDPTDAKAVSYTHPTLPTTSRV